MLKGVIALGTRYVLYALSGALVAAGVAQLTGPDNICLSISAAADWTAGGLALLLGGGATFGATAIWSRIVKRIGGVT